MRVAIRTAWPPQWCTTPLNRGANGRSAVPSAMPATRDPAVELVGEGLPVACVEHGRAAGLHAGAAQFFHEAAHRQALVDSVPGVAPAARIDRLRAALEHACG